MNNAHKRAHIMQHVINKLSTTDSIWKCTMGKSSHTGFPWKREPRLVICSICILSADSEQRNSILGTTSFAANLNQKWARRKWVNRTRRELKPNRLKRSALKWKNRGSKPIPSNRCVCVDPFHCVKKINSAGKNNSNSNGNDWYWSWRRPKNAKSERNRKTNCDESN